MNDSFSFPGDRTAVQIYEADLERLARRIRKTCQAFTLTTLARRWVRGRLRYGPESGEPVPVTEEVAIRFWDPREAWHPGDWAIFPIAATRNGKLRQEPRAGRVVRTMGTALVAQIDGEAMPRLWGTPARRDRQAITQWRASVDRLIKHLGQSRSERTKIDYVLFQQGAEIMSKIMAALRSDGQFIEWEGRWFLRSLVEYPEEAQLMIVARKLLAESRGGVRLSELLSLLSLTETDDFPTMFGFALAMSERPDLFSRLEAGRYTRWVLASPPPGNYEAKFSVYDPQTYEIICESGDDLTADQVEQLWQMNLLATAVYGSS